MIFDKELILSGSVDGANLTGQALNLGANAVNSTNVIDITKRSLAACEDLYLYLMVTTNFTEPANVLGFTLIQTDSAADATSGDSKAVASTGQITGTSLNEKKSLILKINWNPIKERYLMLKYARRSGANPSVGSVFAAFTMGPSIMETYPKGNTII